MTQMIDDTDDLDYLDDLDDLIDDLMKIRQLTVHCGIFIMRYADRYQAKWQEMFLWHYLDNQQPYNITNYKN